MKKLRKTINLFSKAILLMALLFTNISVQAAGSSDTSQPSNASAGPVTFTAISAGTDHTCGLKSDGGVMCWGINYAGQLGDGTQINRNTPRDVVGITPGAFIKISPLSGSVNQAVLTLTWKASSGANQYEYCYDTTKDNTCTVWVSNGLATSKTLTGLTPGVTYYWQVRARNLNGVTYANSSPASFWSFKTNYYKIFVSTPAYDGWVLERDESSGAGAYIDETSALIVGDDEYNSQYRSILSFNTSSLPDNIIITRVTLKFKTALLSDPSPFSTHSTLVADICRGFFGTSPWLEPSDFQAAASLNSAGAVRTMSGTPGWYQSVLNPLSHPFINPVGTTQLRLRFLLDDNNNHIADVVSIYGGDVSAASLRPTLMVEYSLP